MEVKDAQEWVALAIHIFTVFDATSLHFPGMPIC